jgi:hypothetical protein
MGWAKTITTFLVSTTRKNYHTAKRCTRAGLLTWPESPTGLLTGMSVKEVHQQHTKGKAKKKRSTSVNVRKFRIRIQISTILFYRNTSKKYARIQITDWKKGRSKRG